jgi:hypothetical protein
MLFEVLGISLVLLRDRIIGREASPGYRIPDRFNPAHSTPALHPGTPHPAPFYPASRP